MVENLRRTGYDARYRPFAIDLDQVITVEDMQQLFREANVPRKRFACPAWLQKVLHVVRRFSPYRERPPGTSGPELTVIDPDRPATPEELENRDTA